MQITAFQSDHVAEAAALFAASYRAQRLVTPILPDTMEDAAQISAMLERLAQEARGVVVVEHDRLVGYMGWLFVDDFRGAGRKGAYVPVWGHACVEDGKQAIYRRLYRAAAERWAAAGCQVHAITLLAHDQVAEKTWFWNGFGLIVVDAVRPARPLSVPRPAGLQIRPATSADLGALAELDTEHCAHYARSPVFMAPRAGSSPAELAAFLARPKNSIWLALDGAIPVGFMRYEAYDFDGVAIVESDDGIAINGAYVRPAYRGRGAAAALLDAALQDYLARGFTFCAVNFESFNPEAAGFWMTYFDPVCLSVARVPEVAE